MNVALVEDRSRWRCLQLRMLGNQVNLLFIAVISNKKIFTDVV